MQAVVRVREQNLVFLFLLAGLVLLFELLCLGRLSLFLDLLGLLHGLRLLLDALLATIDPIRVPDEHHRVRASGGEVVPVA